MHIPVDVVATLAQVLALLLASTLAFDVVHVLLHRAARLSRAAARA